MLDADATRVQIGLRRGPGRFSAIALYDAGGVGPAIVRARVASLMHLLSADDERERATSVFALSAGMLEASRFADEAESVFPPPPPGNQRPVYARSQNDVLVQLSAGSEIGLRRALRIVSSVLGANEDGGPLTFAGEIMGARIFNNEEAFGFREASPDWQQEAEATLAGFEAPGCWLLFQLYQQDVERFHAELPTANGRADVLGKAPHAMPIGHAASAAERAQAKAEREGARGRQAPADSHFARMRPGGAKLELIRRGFPCRVDGGEGLAFVAAAQHAPTLGDALSRMAGVGGGGPDRLVRYITPVRGGAYFCPVDADWLASGTQPAALPAGARLIDRVPALDDYLVVRSYREYLMRLRRAGLFDDADLPTDLSTDARPHLTALYETLAAQDPQYVTRMQDVTAAKAQQQPPGNITQLEQEAEARLQEVVAELLALEQRAISDARELNGETDDYITFG